MTAAVDTVFISGWNATSTLSPIPMKQNVSRLECSFNRIKLTIVPAMAHSQTKENKLQPQ